MATNMNDFVTNSFNSEEEIERDIKDGTEPVRENDFSKKTWKEDLTLNIDGKQLYVSSGVLAVISPVLSSMIEQIFSEEKEARALDLPGSHADFVEFLRCIYPNVMKAVTQANALKIAPLAHQYEVETLKSMCKEVLVEMVGGRASLDDLCAILTCATACQFSSLRKKCLDEMARHDDHVLDEAMTNLQLTPNVRLDIEKAKVAALTNQVDHLNASVQEQKRTYKEFEMLVRTIWLDDLKLTNKNSVEIRTIHFEVSEEDKTASQSIKIRNVTWKLHVTFRQGNQVPDIVFTAIGDSSWKEWGCKVKTMCSMTSGVNRCSDERSLDMGYSRREHKLSPYSGFCQPDMEQTASQQISLIFAIGDLLV